jgi:hypothetical protein
MSAKRRAISTLARSTALALAGTLALAGVVGAQSGTTGNYEFQDYPGAKCKMVNDWGKHYALVKIVVRPPSVWWPDRDPSKANESGRVGWRAIIQKSGGVDGPWTAVKRTPIQKATAYEGTQAPFTKQSVSWNPEKQANSLVRVVVKAFWYRKDGSVLGRAKHTVLSYKVQFGKTATGSAFQFCGTDVFYS